MLITLGSSLSPIIPLLQGLGFRFKTSALHCRRGNTPEGLRTYSRLEDNALGFGTFSNVEGLELVRVLVASLNRGTLKKSLKYHHPFCWVPKKRYPYFSETLNPNP